MSIAAHQVQQAVEALRIPAYPVRECSICGKSVGFVFSRDGTSVAFDSGCYCSSLGGLQRRGFDDVAGLFNSQAEEVGKRMWAEFLACGKPDDPLIIGFTNYEGEYSLRRIIPLGRPYLGSTEWHPETQWLLSAFDLDKGSTRDFAMKDFGARHEAVAQSRVAVWMLECFGPEITADKVERVDRFIEEALELAQATGWSADRGHALVDYVFGRPVGEIGQEVGGVMVTLAALCNVFGVDIATEIDREVDRITTPEMILKIMAKQASKPVGSALPGNEGAR